MAPGDPNQYSVKEILTDFVLPALDDMRKSQEAKATADEARFQKLEQAKNRATGAFLLITAILVPLSIPVLNLLVAH